MDLETKQFDYSFNRNGDIQLTFTADKHYKAEIEQITELFKDNSINVLKVDKKRKKRSLNANNYAWKLITEIANVLRSNKEEIYLQMLKRYGQSCVVSVITPAVEQFKKTVKYCEEFGQSELNGKEFVHIKVFTGSSEFDTKEMSIFIDGIVSECTDLKICTLTPQEIVKLKNNWRI